MPCNKAQLLVFLDAYTHELEEACRKAYGKGFPEQARSIYNTYKRRIEELAAEEFFRDLFLSK